MTGVFRFVVLFFAVLSVLSLTGAEKIKTAVYKEDPDGLKTYGETGVYSALAGTRDIAPEYISGMTLENLKNFDVLIITKKAWDNINYEPDEWRENVRAWVAEGHGVMAMHETAGCMPYVSKRYYKWDLFPEVGKGHSMIPGREIVLNVGQPVTMNAAPNLSIPNQIFRQQSPDCMIFTPAKDAAVLALGIKTDEKNKKLVMTLPVALAGRFEKGRVILNGMLSGFDFESGVEKAPGGPECHILTDGVRWLAGRLPEKQERYPAAFYVGAEIGDSDSVWREGPDGLALERCLSAEQLAEVNKAFLAPVMEKINPPRLSRGPADLAVAVIGGGKSEKWLAALKNMGFSRARVIGEKDIESGLPGVSALVIADVPVDKKYVPIIKIFMERGGKVLASGRAGYDAEHGKFNLTSALHAGTYIDTVGVEYFSLFMPDELKLKDFDARRGEWIVDRCRTAFKNGVSGMAYFGVGEILKPQSARLDIFNQNSPALKWNFLEDYKKETRYSTEMAPLWRKNSAPMLKSAPLIPQIGYLIPRHTQVRDTDSAALAEGLKNVGINILTVQFSYIESLFVENHKKDHITVLRENLLDKLSPELERRGVQLWVNVFPGRGLSERYCAESPAVCMLDSQGKPAEVICPLRAAGAHAMEFKLLERLFDKYPYLNGISLDEPMIRQGYCFCPECRKLFERMFPGKAMDLNSDEFRKLREYIWAEYLVRPYALFLRKRRPETGVLMLASPGHHKPEWSMNSYELSNTGVQIFSNENAQTRGQCQFDEFWAKHEPVKIACDRLTTLKKHPLLDGVDINKIGGEALRSDVFHGGEALAYVTDGSASYPGVIAANDTASVYFAFDPLAQERFIVNTLRWFIENDRHDVPAGMSQVPAGKFNMKVPREEMTAGRLPDEMISREVFVSGFYMDKYEITNKEYEKFDPAHKRSDLSKDDDMPVTNVTMFDAKKYCNWRSAREKLDPVYAGDKNMTADLSKNGYRLPTVAEWQKAAAGPEGYKYSWGNFWWRANGRVGMDFASGAVKAGSYFPNYYGLYDMTGNVWEWCEDYECYPYRQGRLCGGDWTSDETESRVEFYNFLKDDLWRCSIGFRCARNSLALKHGVSGVQKQ